MERVSGGLPRAPAPIRNSRCPPTESSARHSALSAAYLRWDGSLRSALFPAKVWQTRPGQSRPILNGHRSPNMRMAFVSENLEIVEFVIKNRSRFTPYRKPRQW